jgi:hypothetical protein
MKSMKLSKSVKLSCMIAVGLVMCLLIGSISWADDITCDCKKITVELTSHATTPDPIGPFAGTALVTIGGHHKKTYQADVVSNREGVPTYFPDGTVHSISRNQITIPELASTYECYDHMVFSPVSGDPTRYTVTTQNILFNGTGVFSEAYGKVIAQGEINFAENLFTAKAEGRVCDLGDIK